MAKIKQIILSQFVYCLVTDNILIARVVGCELQADQPDLNSKCQKPSLEGIVELFNITYIPFQEINLRILE